MVKRASWIWLGLLLLVVTIAGVAAAESVHHLVQHSLDSLSVEGEDAVDDAGGSTVVSACHLVSRDEQARHDPRGIRIRGAGTRDRDGAVRRAHAAASRCACWSVEIKASVDSQPSLRLGPLGPSPS